MDSAGSGFRRLACASGSCAVGEHTPERRVCVSHALCYGPELLLEPPQLIASTVRYERGIGGHNVPVVAHSSSSVRIARRLWRQLRPSYPLTILWYAWLSKATKSLLLAVCIWAEGIFVSHPSYRFLCCSLLSRSRTHHNITLTLSITHQAKSIIATKQRDRHQP